MSPAGPWSCGGSVPDLEMGHREADLVPAPGYGETDELPSNTLGSVLPFEWHADGVDGADASADGGSESDLENRHLVIDLVPPVYGDGNGDELSSNTLGRALPMESHADDVDGAGASADGRGSERNFVAAMGEIEMVTPGDGDEETEMIIPPEATAASGPSQPQTPPVDPSPSPPHQLPEAIIPKVRWLLHCVAGDQFTPFTVPIGPYHRGKDCYSRLMEEAKENAVLKLGDLGVNVVRLKRELLVPLEPRVRRCYTHLRDANNGPEYFTDMLLQDGCYLLCFFIEFEARSGRTSSHNLGAQDNTIVRDILYLVENQIPLFVLEEMLSHIITSGSGGEAEEEEAAAEQQEVETSAPASAQQLIAGCVKQVLQKQRYISENNGMRTAPAATDLLHLVYSYFRPPPQASPARRASQDYAGLTGRWRRATDYSRYANLRFKRRRFKGTEEWTILDVKLKGGKLQIPYLRLSSGTWTMLRNLMALEEQRRDKPVTAYCFFISQLACTAEDVELLQRAKILEHFMGSNELVAKAFSELCEGVVLDLERPERNYLRWMWHKLEKRCSKRRNNFKGHFRQEYCSDTFRQVVFTAALITSLCQVMQAIYAVVAYHKPPSPG